MAKIAFCRLPGKQWKRLSLESEKFYWLAHLQCVAFSENQLSLQFSLALSYQRCLLALHEIHTFIKFPIKTKPLLFQGSVRKDLVCQERPLLWRKSTDVILEGNYIVRFMTQYFRRVLDQIVKSSCKFALVRSYGDC